MQPPTTPKQVQAFLGLIRYYRKFIKRFAKNAKPLTMLTQQQVKFEWTSVHHTAFLHLKEAIIQAPILCYPNPNKKYIVYTNASNNACGAQLSQEHDGVEFPVGHFCCTHSQRLKGNGAQLNMRPMESTTQSLSGTTTYKVLTSL